MLVDLRMLNTTWTRPSVKWTRRSAPWIVLSTMSRLICLVWVWWMNIKLHAWNVCWNYQCCKRDGPLMNPYYIVSKRHAWEAQRRMNIVRQVLPEIPHPETLDTVTNNMVLNSLQINMSYVDVAWKGNPEHKWMGLSFNTCSFYTQPRHNTHSLWLLHVDTTLTSLFNGYGITSNMQKEHKAVFKWRLNPQGMHCIMNVDALWMVSCLVNQWMGLVAPPLLPTILINLHPCMKHHHQIQIMQLLYHRLSPKTLCYHHRHLATVLYPIIHHHPHLAHYRIHHHNYHLHNLLLHRYLMKIIYHHPNINHKTRIIPSDNKFPPPIE